MLTFNLLFLPYEIIEFLNHEQYIKRCLEIAKKGIGTTRPNPSVGAVVVVNDRIVGEGYTSPYGGNHAEANAIHSVREKNLLKKATIYVTLEPCSHHGKTPPCSDLIIKSKIKKVVIGALDSNSLVAGKGVERLKNAGCKVVIGVLEKECREHHKRFFTFYEKKRPYIILKWAETEDDFITPKSKKERNPIWITNEVSRQLTHCWRAQEHAILVGAKTVFEDNPKLNARNWKGNNPIRVVIDRGLKTPKDSNVYNASAKTIFITQKEKENFKNLVFEKIDFSKPVASQICDVLYRHKVQSVIIEGGTQTLQTFIKEDFWDEARVFKGKIKFNNGVKAPTFKKFPKSSKDIQGDLLKIYRNG